MACRAAVAVLAGPAVAITGMTSVAGQGTSLAGRYRLDAPVASGGIGQVWRAVDLVLRRPVAVKVLRPEAASDPAARARFHAEARNASRLSHPGVVQVYDFDEDGSPGRPFLVMELVDGPSLATVLARGPLGPGRTVDLIAQVAAGLHAAHSAGMVHRDIKPANLLITADGQVKITDFGIASVARDAPLTSSGILVGTPAYLAPERAAGKPATAASDLYSLGVVGYECLTGAPPFHGPALEVAEAHVRTPFPALPATVPAEVGTLIAALTAKDPWTRPTSAREVAEQAGRLLAGERIGWSGVIPLPPPAASDSPAAVPLTLADVRATQAYRPAPGREMAARRPRARPGKAGAGLAAAAVLTAAVLIAAGLAGWRASLAGAARPHGTAAVPGRSAPPAAPMALVSSARLEGQQASTVLADLLRHGLRPRLSWVPTSAQPPGTVLSVYPDGALPPETVVQVTAAQPAQQAGQAGDGGDGNGGGDGGHGGDGGGGNGD